MPVAPLRAQPISNKPEANSRCVWICRALLPVGHIMAYPMCSMGITIHYIPPSKGDSRLASIRASLGSGRDFSALTVIAPTARLIQNAKNNFAGGQCYIPPRMQTLSALCRALHKTHGTRRVVPHSLIPLMISALTSCGMGLARITAGFIKVLKLHYPGLEPDAVREVILSAAVELNLPDEVQKRALVAIDAWGAYKTALDAAGAIDDDDLFYIGAGIIRDHSGDIKTLVLDGFYEMSNAELEVICALIDSAQETVAFIPVSRPDDDLSHCFTHELKNRYGLDENWAASDPEQQQMEYHVARSMEEEVEDIARQIKHAYVSGIERELEDTVVAFPDITAYRGIIERAFHKYGIPYNIQRSKCLPELRPYADLIALLEAAGAGYPRVEFCRAINSPYFTLMPEALRKKAPALSLMAELGGGRHSWQVAFYNMRVADEGRWLFEQLGALENHTSYAAFLGALGKLTDTLGFKPPVGLDEFELALALIKSLDELMAGVSVTLEGFTEALKVALDRPLEDEARDGVYICELLDLRGLSPKRLYFGGLRDDEMPSKPRIDLLMPENLKHHLGLVDMRRHLRLQEMAFMRLVGSAGAIRLSYPSMDGDKFFIPSLFLSGAQEVKGRVAGIYCEEELQAASARPGAGIIIKQIEGAAPYGPKFSVTAIDAYRQCPRRFYIDRVLQLRPLEVVEYELAPETIGILAHRIMERLGPQYSADGAEYKRRAMLVVNEELSDASALDEYFKALLMETFEGIIPDIHKFETGLRAEGYFFGSAEDKVEQEIGGVLLVGKTDRIDTDAQGAMVMDYKTGASTLSQTGIVNRGEGLQLPLYAAMLRARGVNVQRICMFSLKDLKATFIPGRRKNSEPLDVFIDAAVGYMKDTVARMRDGAYPAEPITDAQCRNCHETPYCPYIQGTTS